MRALKKIAMKKIVEPSSTIISNLTYFFDLPYYKIKNVFLLKYCC